MLEAILWIALLATIASTLAHYLYQGFNRQNKIALEEKFINTYRDMLQWIYDAHPDYFEDININISEFESDYSRLLNRYMVEAKVNTLRFELQNRMQEVQMMRRTRLELCN